MKNIRQRFNEREEKRIHHSMYMNFANAIKEQGFSHDKIRRWLDKLVDKEDFAEIPKRAILENLYALTKPPGALDSGVNLPPEARKRRIRSLVGVS